MILSGLFSTRLDSVVMSLSIYCYFSPRNTLCRKIQSRLDSYGLVRTRLALAVINLNTRLDSSGFVWTHLDSSGLVWTHLDSGFINQNADSFFPPKHTLCRKTRLDSPGLVWTRLDSSGLVWTRLDSSGLIWTQVL